MKNVGEVVMGPTVALPLKSAGLSATVHNPPGSLVPSQRSKAGSTFHANSAEFPESTVALFQPFTVKSRPKTGVGILRGSHAPSLSFVQSTGSKIDPLNTVSSGLIT